MLGDAAKTPLESQRYRVVGSHSAVKICHWTRQSLISGRACYKELWYKGVESHRCLQMTSFIGCNYNCAFCWRVHSGERAGLTWNESPSGHADDPEFILQAAISERIELLSGYWGNEKVDKGKLREALEPKMMTLSLTGESTLYPRVSELVGLGRERNMTTFLVTNGSTPAVLRSMHTLPSQLYLSTAGADEQTYVQLSRPMLHDAWERFNQTVDLLPSLNTTKVLRITVIRGRNMSHNLAYAALVARGKPDFVEVKSYEWVGESQRRLPKSCMPFMHEIREFASRLSETTGYAVAGEFEPSGVVLLSAK